MYIYTIKITIIPQSKMAGGFLKWAPLAGWFHGKSQTKVDDLGLFP